MEMVWHSVYTIPDGEYLDQILMETRQARREVETIDKYMKANQNPVEKLQDWISDAKDVIWNASVWAQNNARTPEAKKKAYDMMIALYAVQKAIDDNLEKIQEVEG